MEISTSLNVASDHSHVTLLPANNQRLACLCGQFDEHIKMIEKHFNVDISNRGNEFYIAGNPPQLQQVTKVLQELYQLTKDHKHISKAQIHLLLQENLNHFQNNQLSTSNQIKTRTGMILTKGQNQTEYTQNIKRYDINFAIGPAGTGKTFLAVACAVEALEKQLVKRLVLVRPAVEAGEKLGFLPGDLVQKIDPYLRPLYDALYETLGFEYVLKLIDKSIIEIAPLAFMRGRTLNESFIILDESQNTTQEQMKMFLTRIGFGSMAVITGDATQIDLPRGSRSGLKHAMSVLENVKGIHFNYFTAQDVVRHPLVQRIIDAYERHE